MKKHYHRIKGALESFREKQVKFGELARKRAYFREHEKLGIEELRSQRLELKHKARHTKHKADLVKAHVHRTRMPKVTFKPNYKAARKLLK